jgi:hypothetical protein
MSELLHNNENLTTADIAHPERARLSQPIAADNRSPVIDSRDLPRARVTGNRDFAEPDFAEAEVGRANRSAANSAVIDNRDYAEEAETEDRTFNADDREGQAVQSPQATAGSAPAAALFPAQELHSYRVRWDQVQTSFVDEPRQAVEQADGLVASVVKRIAEQFSDERAQLERQWDRGDDVSTEDLRQVLKRYRSFFDRLLTTF